MENPVELKIWLYENQGVRRFDAANRFFDTIYTHLDSMQPNSLQKLRIDFRWQGRVYEAYSDILFVVV